MKEILSRNPSVEYQKVQMKAAKVTKLLLPKHTPNTKQLLWPICLICPKCLGYICLQKNLIGHPQSVGQIIPKSFLSTLAIFANNKGLEAKVLQPCDFITINQRLIVGTRSHSLKISINPRSTCWDPSFIYSWFISHILKHKLFCLGQLGLEKQSRNAVGGPCYVGLTCMA